MVMPVLQNFDWKSSPNAPVIYGNYIHVGWTLDDVRITIGAIQAERVNSPDYVATEQGSVVLGWRNIKNLRDALDKVVVAYEDANGTIEMPALAQAK
jgi:hypothetical protein